MQIEHDTYLPLFHLITYNLYDILLASIPLFFKISTVLSCPIKDAKINYFIYFEYSKFILYKPSCNAVLPYLSFIFTSIPLFINISTVFSCPFNEA